MITLTVNLKTFLLTMATNVMAEASGNPLLADFDAPFNTPPFDRIRLEHYEPAFEVAIRMERRDIEAIVANPDEPTFENTIEAIEYAGEKFSQVERIFNTYDRCMSSDSMRMLARKLQPKLIARANSIPLNEGLFARVKAVYDKRASLTLDNEQRALLEKTWQFFTYNGANLDAADKERFRTLSSELASLTLRFGQNVLQSSGSYSMDISQNEAWRVRGIPDYTLESMAQAARDDGRAGWKVTLQAPVYSSFMKYCSDRDAKRELWYRMNEKNLEGQWDNSETIKRIAELRMRIANLLGFKTYADYTLERRMAGTPAAVNELLLQLAQATSKQAHKTFDDVKSYAAKQNGGNFDFSPWDLSYYDERYRHELYKLDDKQIKPYLRLESVRYGVFLLAEKLYGLKFTENLAIPRYHPDVKCYEVHEDKGRFMGILYLDLHSRTGKRAGAWTAVLRDMYTDQRGNEVRPHVLICSNFTKPTRNGPALLSFNEYTTMLHEFGHALHALLCEGRYPTITGLDVYRDFVELPSQLMENFAVERAFLNLWAVHYQTGKKIPRELIDRIVAARNYQAAYINMRQIYYGMIDMAWHSITEPVKTSIAEFERNATPPEMRFFADSLVACVSPSFTHIFSGGYAAGYYSYKWCELLDADAFTLFKKNGVLDRKTAESFRRNILVPGASEDPMTLYVRFRGHKPDVKPMLERMGITHN
ncbi:MAG: M3 family metallopeptidase [Rikenellaceae bacterium]|jgi:peptidyl-dipeptidase Dcp|nr:M3 family metallopeptidase [Rikenellaceae bacterium]